MKVPSLPRELGNGLTLRWASEDDIERQVKLTSAVFREGPAGSPNPEGAPWARDLGSGRHPLSSADRCAYVEDIRTMEMVACVWLIDMTWTYGDIPLRVGRPEHVATHPDYRRRGLIREIFRNIHHRSESEGDLAQAITGIPYYYRQFGYEYALELGDRRRVRFDDIPEVRSGESEKFAVREADIEDLPYLRANYQREHKPCMVANDYSESYWRWMTQEINHESGLGWRPLVITNRSGSACGSILLRSRRWDDTVSVLSFAVNEGVSLLEVLPPALRAIRNRGATIPPLPGRGSKVSREISFDLGSSHPVYDMLGTELAPRFNPPSAWLLRISNLPKFLERIASVLEMRIAASPIWGFTGELHLDFYRSGLWLSFESGRLVAAEDWQAASSTTKPDGGFPPGVFLQLLFGRRSLSELHHILPDVWATEQTEAILGVLFPRLPSHVLPVS